MAEIELEKLEKLSQLRLLEEERESMWEDLNEMIHFAKLLDETENASIKVSVRGDCEVRKDQVEEGLCREDLLFNAPSVQDGFICVPKTVK